MSNRKKATEFLLETIEALQSGNKNVQMYKDHLDGLDDDQFEQLMGQLRDGTVILPFYAPNGTSEALDIDQILKVGESLGIQFEERLRVVDEVSGTTYLTPETYLIIDNALKRQMELVSKKKSVTENAQFTDSISGQAVGVSKAASLSVPELMVLDAQPDHDRIIQELLSIRGGNPEAFRKMRLDTITHGEFSLKDMEALNTNPRAIDALTGYLKTMHLDEIKGPELRRLQAAAEQEQ